MHSPEHHVIGAAEGSRAPYIHLGKVAPKTLRTAALFHGQEIFLGQEMELVAGLGPVIAWLEAKHSTFELHQHPPFGVEPTTRIELVSLPYQGSALTMRAKPASARIKIAIAAGVTTCRLIAERNTFWSDDDRKHRSVRWWKRRESNPHRLLARQRFSR